MSRPTAQRRRIRGGTGAAWARAGRRSTAVPSGLGEPRGLPQTVPVGAAALPVVLLPDRDAAAAIGSQRAAESRRRREPISPRVGVAAGWCCRELVLPRVGVPRAEG